MATVVQDIDHGWKRIRRDTKRSRELVVALGILASGDQREDGESNAVIYATHEYGEPELGIPERSSLRSTLDRNDRQYAKVGAQLSGHVLDGRMSPEQALGLLGARGVADVQRTIRQGIPPPLAWETVERKGSTTPLIDTGDLIQSLNFEVRRA